MLDAIAQHNLERTVNSDIRNGIAIDFEGVSQVFVHGDAPVTAISDFNLKIRPGEFVCIVGPSGCGKTTALSMLAGLLRPQLGSVRIDGGEVMRPRPDVAYMFARDALLPWRTVRGNVELGLEVRRLLKDEIKMRSDKWIHGVGLERFADSSVGKLSQGQRQRVAIARTLAQSPRLILMDEPFAALDAQTRVVMQNTFTKLWQESGATILFITHDLTEAILMGDRVVLMSNRPGRVLSDTSIDLKRPRTHHDIDTPEFQRLHKDILRQLEREVGSLTTIVKSGENRS